MSNQIDILHVPFTYFPDAFGGTEVYVNNLAQELIGLGYSSAVAAPAGISSVYNYEGKDVYRFATDPIRRLEQAYGIPDEFAVASFRKIVSKTTPSIIHLHARTAAVSSRLIDVARETGAKVVFTYHTATASCGRGDMMLFGKLPCDGLINRRCLPCTLCKLGLPEGHAWAISEFPSWFLFTLGYWRGLPNSLRIPGLIEAQQNEMRKMLRSADYVVAVCDWVSKVLLVNGIPEQKIFLSRQGIVEPRRPMERYNFAQKTPNEPLRLAYFGRLDPMKGVSLLCDAFAQIPDANVNLTIFAVTQPGEGPNFGELGKRLRADSRISIMPAIPPSGVVEKMCDYDLIAVPSQCLESGPLVVLEAFAAGIPVVGADLGGISELVQNNKDGVLISPWDVAAWATAIRDLSLRPDAVIDLKKNIRYPKTMVETATEMASLYKKMGVNPRQ